MTPLFRCLSSVAVAVMLTPAGHAVAQQATNPTAAALEEWTKQVKAYMDIHTKAE